MKQINRKLLRDLWHIKWQAVSIALVIMSGVAAFVTSISTHDSLKLGQQRFYHEGRFGDVFAELKRAPNSLAHRLVEIPGVVSLETRIVKDYLLHIPGRIQAASGRFISLPPSGTPRLNHVYLRHGRLPAPGSQNEVLVNEAFAEANNFKPGSKVIAIINGKYEELYITGTALSPEYIYPIQSGSVLPDERNFGIFWMPEESLAQATDMDGAFNSLSLILGPMSSERAVIAAIDEVLLPYGSINAYGRVDQPSNLFLTDDISLLRALAVFIPIIFLGVAAFLLHVVINRLIGLQRPQIATLKAIGYRNTIISAHYLKLVTIIVILGILIGIGLGFWFGEKTTSFYTQFYRFPFMIFVVRPPVIIWAIAASFAAALIGIGGALFRVFRLTPADAMRPAAPPAFHRTLSERLALTRHFSLSGKMIYRNLALRPLRTAFGLIGMGSAVMVTILGLFWWDTIHYLIYSEFSLSQRDDIQVAFTDHLSQDSLQELDNYPGVLAAEGYRSLPVRLRAGHREKKTTLLGYPSHSQMRLLLSKKHKVLNVPPEGLMLSQLLANRLGVEAGDSIDIEALEGKRQRWHMRVNGIVDQWIGLGAYADLDSLQRILDDRMISAVSLNVDSQQEAALHAALKKAPKVAAVNVKRDVLQMFEQTMVVTLTFFSGILTAFALVIAIGVVYNNTRVSLSERAWELMSLRVLGFTRREVFRILQGEFIFYLIGALPLGCLLGYVFAHLLMRHTHTQAFEIPIIIETHTFAYASLVVVVCGIVSMLLVKKRLDRMELVAALKIRE